MRHFILMAAIVFWALSATAQANLLTNGNLDNPGIHESDVAVGWTLVEPDVDGMGAPINSATFASFADHTGAGGVGLWYRSFEGGFGGDEPFSVNADLYQDVAAVAGADYAVTAWYLMEANYSGLDNAVPTQTILALEFLDAGAAVIGSSTLDIDTVYDTGAPSTWQQFNVNGTAPAGAVTVRVRSSMINGVIEMANPQSAFVDDLDLSVRGIIPEPASAALLGLAALMIVRRRAS